EGLAGDLTRTGFWALTPAYASPEQLRQEDVTTASDVYSLGVVLYQVLTGRLPREIESLGRGDVERALASPPPAPSSVLRGAGPATGGTTRRGLPEDLDAVVLQALKVDPGQRYPSVERFADDLRNVLAGRPVSARRSTLVYRLRLGLRRHRLAATLGAAALLTFSAFSAFTWQQARALERQRDLSRHEQESTQAVAAFLADVLRDADPARSGGRDVSVRDAVDKSARRLPERLGRQPQIHAGLLHMVGSIYRGLGAADQARPMLERALALRRQALGDASPLVADTLLELCVLERDNGAQEAAEGACGEALAILRRALPAAHREVIVGIYELSATHLQGLDLEPAAALLEEALVLQGGDPAVPPEEIAISRARLARVWAELDRLDQATALALEVAEDLETSAIAGSARHATALSSTANVLWMAGRAREAEALSLRAEEMFLRNAGPDHPRLAAFRNDRALEVYDLGRTEEAIALLSQAMADADRDRAPSSFVRHTIRSNLAEILVAAGRPAEAEALLDESSAAAGSQGLGPLGPRLALIRGAARLALGDPDSAQTAFEQALVVLRARLPADHSLIAETESHLGAALVAGGATDRGLDLLDRSHERLGAALGAQHPKTRAAAERRRRYRELATGS
ncbi:MAG: tetratricopeptide repeat protein, partial [Acidobacteria bacterium]|nr:tetratricopeptide repeat protein [Acidobacteriota bacterium]